MSIYSSRALGRSLGAFSAFAGGGRVIFGPFSFAESYSSDDFGSAEQFTKWVKPFLDQVGRKDLTWDPPASALKTRAAQNFKTWKDAGDLGNAGAAAYAQSIINQMTDLIARADELSINQSLGKRSEGNEVARYDIFNEISAIIKKLSASTTKANAAMTAALAAGAGDELPVSPPVSQNPAPVAGDITSGATRNPYMATAGGTGDPITPPAASDNTMLYAGLGLGAVVLLGVGIMIMKKKPPAVGRYRRSRRSRSHR